MDQGNHSWYPATLLLKVRVDWSTSPVDRWTARSRTWGSPTCLRRSLPINPNFKKKSSWVPRMIPLIHPDKHNVSLDILLLFKIHVMCMYLEACKYSFVKSFESIEWSFLFFCYSAADDHCVTVMLDMSCHFLRPFSDQAWGFVTVSGIGRS